MPLDAPAKERRGFQEMEIIDALSLVFRSVQTMRARMNARCLLARIVFRCGGAWTFSSHSGGARGEHVALTDNLGFQDLNA